MTYQEAYKEKNGTICNTCNTEIIRKSYVCDFANVGSPEEWIEQLKDLNTVEDTKHWWNQVNDILWDKKQYSQLIKVYIRKLAVLTGKEWLAGDKPFPKGIPGMGKVYAEKV